jgi:crossover junction endodeoxyribonuclease RuvC
VIVIGIDIGLTGAIAAVDSHQTCAIRDLPLHERDRRIDGAAFIRLVRELVPAGMTAIAVIEDVRPRQVGNGGRHFNSSASQASLSLSRGIITGALDIARIGVEVVQPQAWKRKLGLLKASKDDSIAKACDLYPLADIRLKKHHNRAEALLIAHYGRQVLT